MIALILLTADGMVLTSQIAVDARVDAFKRSLEHKSPSGIDRFLLEDIATTDRYKRDIINGNASGSLAVVSVFPSARSLRRRSSPCCATRGATRSCRLTTTIG